MPKLTRAAFDELVRTDPAAVFALVEQLTARIEELEARLGGNSRNSHRPPASDPPGTPKRARPAGGRQPGGQPGHPGHTLRFVESPDRVETHPPAQCGRCGQPLPAPDAAAGYERRQVVEVPPRRVEVTEHRGLRVACAACGHVTTGAFPEAVPAPVQYGPRLRALGIYLLTHHLLPNERATELLRDVLGCPMSVATLQRAVTAGASRLVETEQRIATALSRAPVLHCDETGVSVNGDGWWLHVASTSKLTHYAVHAQRGRAATDAIGILARATGRLLHDHWAAYWHYAGDHALCNAHHLRELTAVEERDAESAWATRLKALLRAMRTHVAARRAGGETAIRDPVRRGFLRQYHACLDEGDRHNPPVPASGRRGRTKQTKTRNLLDRLRTRQEAVLAFLDDWRVPFDNNQAERDLRMVKVQQKISGTFRSADGARAFCRWRGYLSTLRKQGRDLLEAITQTLLGQPLLPDLVS